VKDTKCFRVQIMTRTGLRDARGAGLQRQAEALGIVGVENIAVSDLYFLEGAFDAVDVARLAELLLCDPVVEQATVTPLDGAGAGTPRIDYQTVEVILHPGVTDSVAEHLLEGARMAGIESLARAATGQRYEITGRLAEGALARLSTLLANPVIQSYAFNGHVAPPLTLPQPTGDVVEVIPLTAADAAGLEAVSRERRLALDLAEMRAIQDYYCRERREPTDVELEMLAQTWSEHCVHKTFRALIDYEERTADGRQAVATRRVDSLLKTYIRAATEQAARPWVLSAFVDNAGIIAFDDYTDLAFKVETHNHPSALEPFGGANTGVGGVVRDVIGVSARPIANTDVLCFGPADLPFEDLPAGVLHPRRIADGVTAGVEDYGNKMGIPTINGAILYDPGYTANPLVFCGCLGILPHGSHRASPQAGDFVVVIGGRTGRDGLRGATFSSMEMTHETGNLAGSAVQIGHPIHEKQALEAVLMARDEGLYTAITDCGAGGLSSAVGEMAAELGAEIDLERVPLKYSGLEPWEIWLSEAQERMVLAMPPAHWPRLQTICTGLDIEATALGTFTGDGQITLRCGERIVGRLDAHFLHHGIPRRHLQAVWSPPVTSEPDPAAFPSDPNGNLTSTLLVLLASPDIRSKEDVVRRYDHEVQGAGVGKPFSGAANAGPADAAVLDLRFAAVRIDREQPATVNRGVAVSAGINPAYGALDPYAMAWAAVDEALRNCVAAGADPDQVALLDNFCWGNPSLPDRLGGLVRCAEGCYDAAVAYGAPFISGKDSLNNEYTGIDGRKHAIPGTLLISAVGIVPDTAHAVTLDLKAAGNRLYVLGLTCDELGASAYYSHHGLLGANVPQPPAHGLDLMRGLHRASAAGLVQACHDCSEGGLVVTAAEMSLAGGLGLTLDLRRIPQAPETQRDATLAFSESLGRFLVEVRPDDADAFEACCAGLPCTHAGDVQSGDRCVLLGLGGQPVVDAAVSALEHAWRGHLA
jgi:phosphoribosylformylglycinamidine synthase subunit PurSL